tara:strand:- start:1008 stop:1169 length:162 start_codon:yes stop_codon:yes gene_type:complete
MDKYIQDDENNPINWNGTNPTCEICNTTLDCFFDYENICNECYNKEEEEEEKN